MQKEAQRSNNRHRATGTMETKFVEVAKEVCKRKTIDDVVPAIRAAWPRGTRNWGIWVQRDNAPSHNIYK